MQNSLNHFDADLTNQGIRELFGNGLSSLDDSVSFEDKQKRVLEFLKSNKFQSLSQDEKIKILNDSGDNPSEFSPVNYLGIHEAGRVLKYLFDNNLVAFTQEAAVETLFLYKHSNTRMKTYFEEIIKENIALGLEYCDKLTVAFYLTNAHLEKDELQHALGVAGKDSLFIKTIKSFISDFDDKKELSADDVLKLTTEQQHAIYLAKLLDDSVEYIFSAKLDVDIINEITEDFDKKKGNNTEHEDLVSKVNDAKLFFMFWVKNNLAGRNTKVNAIYKSLYENFSEVVKKILSTREPINTKSIPELKILLFSIYYGREDSDYAELMVYLLLLKTDVNVIVRKSTLVNDIIHQCYYIGLKFLFEHDGDLNVPIDDRTIITRIAAGGEFKAVKLLASMGAKPAPKDNNIISLLELFRHRPISEYEIEMMNFLIGEVGTNLETRDKYGNTVLHLAVEEKRLGVVRMLLNNSISIDIKNKEGKTPLDIAENGGNEEIIALLTQAATKRAITTATTQAANVTGASVVARQYLTSYLNANLKPDQSRGK